jgi:hypothetical protein
VISPETEKNFADTFGKNLDRKAFLKAVIAALKTKEVEYYNNLISHLSEHKLIQLKEELNGSKKTKYPNT